VLLDWQLTAACSRMAECRLDKLSRQPLVWHRHYCQRHVTHATKVNDTLA